MAQGKKKRPVIAILIVAVILLIVAAIFFKKGDGGIEVEVTKPEKRTITEMVSASGKIYPEDEVAIIPEIAGEIIELMVQDGDSVQRDDVLVRINPDIFQDALKRTEAAVLTAKANLGNTKARAAQARAQYERARLDFGRQQQLFEQQVISKAEYDAAEAAFKVAEAELEAGDESVKAATFQVQSAEATLQEARNNLARTTVYAPMAGIVTGLNVEEGKVVGGINTFSATEMMRISDLSAMEVRVDVSENDILRISVGDTALIEVEAYDDREFKGIVTQISSSATNANRQLTTETATNFTVRIRLLESSYADLLNPEKGQFPFLPGMSASVDIITQVKTEALSIPIEAVTTRTPKQIGDTTGMEVKNDLVEVVFGLHEDNTVRPILVKTGIQDDKYIEVLEGIAEGETIISGPYTTVQRTLQRSDKVTISEEDGKAATVKKE